MRLVNQFCGRAVRPRARMHRAPLPKMFAWMLRRCAAHRPFHATVTRRAAGTRAAIPTNVVMAEDVVVGPGFTFEAHDKQWTRLHAGVTVGAHAHIGAGVTLGRNVTIPSHCVVRHSAASDFYLRVRGVADAAWKAALALLVVLVCIGALGRQGQ